MGRDGANTEITRGITMLTSSLFLVLFCGLLGDWVLSICPSMCSCSGGHRDVDCSLKSLTKLPHGLQHNIRFLNLSFNRRRGHSSRFGCSFPEPPSDPLPPPELQPFCLHLFC
ncbi:oligodendrocyte-myelin glycoprotein-like isoform X6 [Poecilia reticulata]|uniref:oligodendrocyte-myelin glycoprotein-like isoform X6 n=1 Tax=Poecilia reticulata TaxID=8081 RepID=UPI0004A35947|nr:PREDICTED: oligodendrocyte-myelin glycoprotein-like isoform X6 [Poecilia reticulata]